MKNGVHVLIHVLPSSSLAVTLLHMRNFSSNDFAKYHPGGTLGKKLFLTVKDLVEQNEKPSVELNSNIKEVIIEISEKRLGVSAVVKQNKLNAAAVILVL